VWRRMPRGDHEVLVELQRMASRSELEVGKTVKAAKPVDMGKCIKEIVILGRDESSKQPRQRNVQGAAE
jgi:hypothetical protein